MVKYDLACGTGKQEGFIGVDVNRSVRPDHVVDLLHFPWGLLEPADEIFCSHFIEHIPLETRDGKDLLVLFMEECYRFCLPDSKVVFVYPNAMHENAYRDPTHRRFLCKNSLAYFDKALRERCGVGWYDINTDFEIIQITCSGGPEIVGMPDLERRVQHEWNIASEIRVEMVARKPMR